MAYVPLRQAADLAGVTRQTLYRMAADGRLSVVSRKGQKAVDTAELLRVFGELQQPGQSRETRRPSAPASATVTLQQVEVARLQVELDAARREVEMLRQLLREQQEASRTREEAGRQEVMRMLGILEQSTRLLEYRRADNAPPPEPALPATAATEPPPPAVSQEPPAAPAQVEQPAAAKKRMKSKKKVKKKGRKP